MALSPAVQTQLKALIAAEGGIQSFIAEIQDLNSTNMRASAVIALMPAITATVQDWTALEAFLGQITSGAPMLTIMTAIATARTAKDDSQLGAMLWSLYAAIKALQRL